MGAERCPYNQAVLIIASTKDESTYCFHQVVPSFVVRA
jgi:hypothetical protein